MIRMYMLSVLFCIPILSIYAGDGQRAQELLNFLMAGQGDSIHVRLNDELKEKLPSAMFNDTFSTLEKQVGKYQSYGEWKKDVISETTIHYCDIQFERAPLRFMVAFDTDGKVNTIRFMPAPVPAPVSTIKIDTEKLEEQSIEVVCGKYKLPGVLTLPKDRKNIPIVILVHGSGPQDRDETIGPNKPFRDLAWGLAERGIASIRYDKRTKVYGAGYAEGGGTYDEETVDDALAAVELAKTLSIINPREIYIIGHSLGAMLAPRMAERSKELVGVIMMAGNARPLENLLLEQVAYIASLQGLSPEVEKQIEELKQQVANIKKLGIKDFDESIPMPFGSPRSYWEFSNQYKQVEVAKKLSLPMLFLQGERDYQVTMHDFGLWRSGLSGKSNVYFKSYPALNHLFHEGSGKSTPMEYNQEKHIPGYVMDDIAHWINDKNSIMR